MSQHFHAHQFNQPYGSRRLGNWEVPRSFPLKFPPARTGRTTIIANDRGHLLPGVPRPQAIGTGPWGHFIPTWRMPKRITRDIAVELRNPKPKTPKKVEPPPEVVKEPPKIVDEEPPSDVDPCEGLHNKTQEIKTVCPIHG